MEGVASNSGNHSPLAQSCCGLDAKLGFLNFTVTMRTDRMPVNISFFVCYGKTCTRVSPCEQQACGIVIPEGSRPISLFIFFLSVTTSEEHNDRWILSYLAHARGCRVVIALGEIWANPVIGLF